MPRHVLLFHTSRSTSFSHILTSSDKSYNQQLLPPYSVEHSFDQLLEEYTYPTTPNTAATISPRSQLTSILTSLPRHFSSKTDRNRNIQIRSVPSNDTVNTTLSTEIATASTTMLPTTLNTTFNAIPNNPPPTWLIIAVHIFAVSTSAINLYCTIQLRRELRAHWAWRRSQVALLGQDGVPQLDHGANTTSGEYQIAKDDLYTRVQRLEEQFIRLGEQLLTILTAVAERPRRLQGVTDEMDCFLDLLQELGGGIRALGWMVGQLEGVLRRRRNSARRAL